MNGLIRGRELQNQMTKRVRKEWTASLIDPSRSRRPAEQSRGAQKLAPLLPEIALTAEIRGTYCEDGKYLWIKRSPS